MERLYSEIDWICDHHVIHTIEVMDAPINHVRAPCDETDEYDFYFYCLFRFFITLLMIE